MDSKYEVVCHSADRPEWLKQRRTGIGASDAAGVLNVSPWSSAVSVFASKYLGDEERDSEPMMWGRKLESVILDHFAEETSRKVVSAGNLLRSKEWPFMMCTLDGLQWHDPFSSKGPTGFVEIKNTRFSMTEGVPKNYWIQMQHQYCVTGFEEGGSFGVLTMGSEFFWCDVERDDDFINGTLVPACESLWKRVLNGGPTPSPDPSDATLEALKRIYKEDEGGTVELDGSFIDDTARREEIVDQLKDLKSEQQGIDNRVKHALGVHTYGTLPSGRRFSWKARKDGVRVLRAPKAEGV